MATAAISSLIRERIQVIFDGVDQNFFCPSPAVRPLVLSCDDGRTIHFTPDQLILSYGTRGMEPLRGFPEFMRAAAVAQQHFPALQVVVFGNDRSAYSYESPHPSGSWKQYMLEELKNDLDFDRLHFTGLLNYGELVQLFRRSNLHCYFTRPYVVSWGVFQAAACGSRLLVNDFPGLDEVFGRQLPIPPVDLERQNDVTQAVLAALGQNGDVDSVGISLLAPGLSLENAIRQWRDLLRRFL